MLRTLSLPRGRPLRTLIFLAFTLIIVYCYRQNVPRQIPIAAELSPLPPSPKPVVSPPCLSLPNLSSVALIIKTSAAEVEQKLPDLLSSTLTCFPTYAIYSDHAETYLSQPIFDALASVSPKLKDSHPDFDLYRRLQKAGPDTLADEEMWSADRTSQKLDKWKMLPMIQSTFEQYGQEKSWFIFVDMKTHFFQSNLLTWLNTLNASEPYFLNVQGSDGEASMLVDSGSFVLSYPAIEAVSAEYTARKTAYEQLTKERATGHSVLRHIVEKARSRTTSLQMTKAWPMFHPRGPPRIDYSERSFFERLWCYPAIFHEGLNTAEIAELWKWEQGWLKEYPGKIIKHSDVFQEFISPRLIIRGGKVDVWDNLSDGDGLEKGSVEECTQICVERPRCVQWSYKNGQCYFSEKPRMGVRKTGVQSRWLLARLQKFGYDMEECTGKETWD